MHEIDDIMSEDWPGIKLPAIGGIQAGQIISTICYVYMYHVTKQLVQKTSYNYNNYYTVQEVNIR